MSWSKAELSGFVAAAVVFGDRHANALTPSDAKKINHIFEILRREPREKALGYVKYCVKSMPVVSENDAIWRHFLQEEDSAITAARECETVRSWKTLR